MQQKKIILDKEFFAFKEIRTKIPEKIESLIVLLERLKNLNSTDLAIIDFISFLEDLLFEKYGKQRNNHNFMKTFLKEKVSTHQRIPFDRLDSGLANGKIPYAKNVSPKTIMSNYFFSNESEDKLNVSKLENAFVAFTRSDRTYLNKEDDYKKIDKDLVLKMDDGSFIKLKDPKIKLNDKLIHEDEIDDLKNYFALQLTRREFFLQNMIKTCLSGIYPKKLEDLDLLDYLHIKYIYNKAIPENYTNWQESLKNNNILYQVQYRSPTIMKTYKDLKKDLDDGVKVGHIPLNLAITEAHTLHLVSLISAIKPTTLKKTMQANGFTPFSKKDFQTIEGAVVTMGSNDKLCYLMQKKPDNILLEKIHFVIHAYWDKIMANATLLNLLLSKISSLNSVPTFKNTPQANKVNAVFMSDIFTISEFYEDVIEKESIVVKSNN